MLWIYDQNPRLWFPGYTNAFGILWSSALTWFLWLDWKLIILNILRFSINCWYNFFIIINLSSSFSWFSHTVYIPINVIFRRFLWLTSAGHESGENGPVSRSGRPIRLEIIYWIRDHGKLKSMTGVRHGPSVGSLTADDVLRKLVGSSL